MVFGYGYCWWQHWQWQMNAPCLPAVSMATGVCWRDTDSIVQCGMSRATPEDWTPASGDYLLCIAPAATRATGKQTTIKWEARDTWLEMNGWRGIEKGCLLVYVAIGPRTAIVNVLTVLETQNLEPNRTYFLPSDGRGGVGKLHGLLLWWFDMVESLLW